MTAPFRTAVEAAWQPGCLPGTPSGAAVNTLLPLLPTSSACPLFVPAPLLTPPIAVRRLLRPPLPLGVGAGAAPAPKPAPSTPGQGSNPSCFQDSKGQGPAFGHGTIVQWRFGHAAYQAQIPADRAWRPAERQPGAAAAAGLRSEDAPARLLRAHLQQPRRGRLGVSPPRRQRGLHGRRGNGQLPHGRFCPWQGPAGVLPG